jgi:phosphomevalonate kinase
VLPDYAVNLHFSRTDPVFSFFSPDYSSEVLKNNHIPDFRNTLYWNPSLKPDDDGKFRIEFYSSDMESDYTINIQGVNADGRPLSLRKVITIK